MHLLILVLPFVFSGCPQNACNITMQNIDQNFTECSNFCMFIDPRDFKDEITIKHVWKDIIFIPISPNLVFNMCSLHFEGVGSSAKFYNLSFSGLGCKPPNSLFFYFECRLTEFQRVSFINYSIQGQRPAIFNAKKCEKVTLDLTFISNQLQYIGIIYIIDTTLVTGKINITQNTLDLATMVNFSNVNSLILEQLWIYQNKIFNGKIFDVSFGQTLGYNFIIRLNNLIFTLNTLDIMTCKLGQVITNILRIEDQKTTSLLFQFTGKRILYLQNLQIHSNYFGWQRSQIIFNFQVSENIVIDTTNVSNNRFEQIEVIIFKISSCKRVFFTNFTFHPNNSRKSEMIKISTNDFEINCQVSQSMCPTLLKMLKRNFPLLIVLLEESGFLLLQNFQFYLGENLVVQIIQMININIEAVIDIFNIRIQRMNFTYIPFHNSLFDISTFISTCSVTNLIVLQLSFMECVFSIVPLRSSQQVVTENIRLNSITIKDSKFTAVSDTSLIGLVHLEGSQNQQIQFTQINLINIKTRSFPQYEQLFASKTLQSCASTNNGFGDLVNNLLDMPTTSSSLFHVVSPKAQVFIARCLFNNLNLNFLSIIRVMSANCQVDLVNFYNVQVVLYSTSQNDITPILGIQADYSIIQRLFIQNISLAESSFISFHAHHNRPTFITYSIVFQGISFQRFHTTSTSYHLITIAEFARPTDSLQVHIKRIIIENALGQGYGIVYLGQNPIQQTTIIIENIFIIHFQISQFQLGLIHCQAEKSSQSQIQIINNLYSDIESRDGGLFKIQDFDQVQLQSLLLHNQQTQSLQISGQYSFLSNQLIDYNQEKNLGPKKLIAFFRISKFNLIAIISTQIIYKGMHEIPKYFEINSSSDVKCNLILRNLKYMQWFESQHFQQLIDVQYLERVQINSLVINCSGSSRYKLRVLSIQFCSSISIINIQLQLNKQTDTAPYLLFLDFTQILVSEMYVYGFRQTNQNAQFFHMINRGNVGRSIFKYALMSNFSADQCCSQIATIIHTEIAIQTMIILNLINWKSLSILDSSCIIFKSIFHNVSLSLNYKDINLSVQEQTNYAQFNGAVLNSQQASLSIGHTLFKLIKGSYFGGAISLGVNNTSNTKLSFSAPNFYIDCTGVLGGAIYHRSISINQLSQSFSGNQDMFTRFNDVSGTIDTIILYLLEDKKQRINVSVRTSRHISIKQIKPGSKLQIQFQLSERRIIHPEELPIKISLENNGVVVNISTTFSGSIYSIHIPSLMEFEKKFTLSLEQVMISNNRISDSNILFNLYYRSCFPGEYLNFTGCSPCENNTYTNDRNQRICLDCPTNIDCSGGQAYKLAKGFWRKGNTSIQIIDCKPNKDACQEDPIKREKCLSGYIGAICQTCDLSAIHWSHNHLRSENNQCEQCTKTSLASSQYIANTILIVVVLQLQLIMTYQSNISNALVLFIRKAGLLQFGTSGLFSTDAYVKTLIFHFSILQIYSSVSQQGTGLFSTIFNYYFTVSNQGSSVFFSFDCLQSFLQIFSSIAYQDIILAFGLLIVLIILSSLLSLFARGSKSHYLKFELIYVFWTQFPLIFIKLISSIACTNILGNWFLNGDLTIKCFDRSYYMHLSYLTIPFTLAIIVIAVLIWRHLQSLRMLQWIHLKNIIIFGFFFQNFRQQYYHFEFAKLFLKIIAVCLVQFLNNSIIMAVCIIVLLSFYIRVSQKLHPYIYYKTQSLDLYQTETLVLSLQITIVNQIVSSPNAKTAMETLLVVINMIFLLVFLSSIMQALFVEIDISSILIKITQKVSFLKMTIRPKTLQVFHHWRILRRSLNNKQEQSSSKVSDREPSLNLDFIDYF